ncbi:TetR/AcrR family transcriptional regulator [Salipiger bermudensis]|uniref:TetR/AcrR family transcriptional regulator n=1 Tax=Salipiger bermudensis TaxID=344736 RepID=UPI001C997E91|nr:TetR/AcrR family transcriptional regulator [Salipiger bermudensis]MBY6005014.1 TetR/AcrR family transcriptional regulator [Salipiger bermudensis]
MTKSRESYHHGQLREALITAADDILHEGGIEGFSLRKAAARAGVSPGAPAHHFKSVNGLLTAVAVLTLDELADRMRTVSTDQPIGAQVRELASIYVRYSMEFPGRLQVTYRRALIDRNDPEFMRSSGDAFGQFFTTAARYHGVTIPSRETASQLHPQLLLDYATLQGMALTAVESNWRFIVSHDDPQGDFLRRILPMLVEARWPDKPAA